MFGGLRERAVGAGYSAGWGMIKTLPTGVSARAFRAAADAATVRNGRGVQQLRANLRRVVGPGMSELRMDALIGEALRSYSRYWLETFRLETMDHHAVAESNARHLRGGEHVAAAVERGGGLILALPHSGNWDAAGTWYIDRHGPFTTVAERLKPESVFDRFVAYRESLGMEVIALTGGEQSPTQVLAQRLKAGATICLLADRDLSRNGIEVDFFGETARMPGGPAMLAARTGARLLPAFPYFIEGGWGLTFGAPLTLPGERLRDQVRGGTQLLADWFAAHISKHPADWHMLQRLWVADLQPHDPRTRAAG